MTGLRRLALILTATAVAGLGLATTATAATITPGAFTLDVTSAKVGIGPVPSIPINPATLGGQAISLSGTVAADGRLAVPKDKIALPAVTIPIPKETLSALITAVSSGGTGGLDLGGLLGGLLGGVPARSAATGATTAAAPRAASGATTAATPAIDPTAIVNLVGDLNVKAGITPTGPATGTLDAATGATALDLGLSLGVSANAAAGIAALLNPLVTCGVSPLPFKLTTGSVPVPGTDKTLTGSPLGADGVVTLVGAVDSPAPGCKLASILSTALGGADPLAGLSTDALGAATLELTGRLALPAPAAQAPPTVTTTTPAIVPGPTGPKKVAAALLKVAKTIKVTGRTVAIKIACQVLDCSGKVTLAPVTATSAGKKKATAAKALGARSYKAKAGKTATVKVTLSSAARALLKKKHKARVRVTVSVAGGAAAQKTVTLTAPAAKKGK